MSNIISNLSESIFNNPATITFLIVIMIYSIIKISENRNLYNFINRDLVELNENYKNSKIYISAHNNYDLYKQENPYSDVNITSFIEELASGFIYKKRFTVEKIKYIKNASSNCILLGVLGTFVGLSTMLLSVDTNNIINSLPTTISNMQTAFTTSIFGIVCSMLINFSIKLNNCEHNLVQLMLKLENLLTSEVSHIKSERINLKIEEVKNTIKRISESIKSIEKFDKISRDLNDFNDKFIDGIETFKKLSERSENSIKEFAQSVRKLDKQFNILNIKFVKLFDKYENQDEINREILIDIKSSTKSIYESVENQYKIKDYMKNLNSILGLYERNTQDLLTKLVTHEENIITTQNNILLTQSNLNEEKEDLSNSVSVLNDTINQFSQIMTITLENIQRKLDDIITYLDLYKKASSTPLDNIKFIIKPYAEEIYEIEYESSQPKEMLNTEKIYSIIKNLDLDKDDLND